MLELYQSEGCPWCKKARTALSDLGVSYVIHNPRLPSHAGGDVTNQQTYDELQAIGGENQIPFLVDHARGETLYESADIVDYLETHYA